MKTPSEMTNAELASLLEDGSTLSIQGDNSNAEIAKRLRAMSDPKPDFYVGWRGLCKCDTAAIHGIDHETGLLYGQAGEEACCWRSDVSAVTNGTGYDLIPNTPPEPEIFYRHKFEPNSFYKTLVDYNVDFPDDVRGLDYEKVSVQVIP